jgi:hypothetical protein
MHAFTHTQMLGKEMYFDDLASLDPDLYKNLLFVKNYQGDFEELGLTFVINEVCKNHSHVRVRRQYFLCFI